MSLTSVLSCTALLLFAPLSSAQSVHGGKSDTLSCPPGISVKESVSAPPEWTIVPGPVELAFERASIYQVSSDGKQFDLAPDEEPRKTNPIVQVWNLPGDRSMPIFLVCRYRNSLITLRRKISPDLHKCTLTYVGDERGQAVGLSAADCH